MINILYVTDNLSYITTFFDIFQDKNTGNLGEFQPMQEKISGFHL